MMGMIVREGFKEKCGKFITVYSFLVAIDSCPPTFPSLSSIFFSIKYFEQLFLLADGVFYLFFGHSIFSHLDCASAHHSFAIISSCSADATPSFKDFEHLA